MGWRDLLQKDNEESVIYPWCGGRQIQTVNRAWTIKGRLPQEVGWYTFQTSTRKATLGVASDPDLNALSFHQTGYLVGERFIPDTVASAPQLSDLLKQFERVNLLEPGLDKFVRVKVGRTYEGGQLIYCGEEFPLGSEEEVLEAFFNEEESVDFIANVSPALDCAFRYETWKRTEQNRIREEERIRREQEERRRKLRESLGDGQLRREMALEDFGAAAKAALQVGGATYLDHQPARRKGEMVVRFRYLNRRFECICNARTLRIVDSGICLINHATGEKGDAYFTLESLPPVISNAYNDDRLVQFRH